MYTNYLSEAEYERWSNIVACSPEGSIYSSPEYLEVLCEATDGKFKILVAMQGDEIVGGVALYERASAFGTYVSPRLLLYYNGLVLRDYDTKYPSLRESRRLEIISALEERLSRAGYAKLRLKNRSAFNDSRVFLAKGWTVSVSYTYVVPLDNIELLWNRVEQNLRRLINRCSQQGLQLSADEDFDSFYRMHHQTHERKGADLYLPRPRFQRYFERLKSQNLCRLFHARLPNSQSIASQLVLLGRHPVSHTVCAAADKEYLSLGASAFLRWKVFAELSALGFKGNDLTDAWLNSVTKFKSQLGGDLHTNLILTKPEAFTFRVSHSLTNIMQGGGRRLKRLFQRKNFAA